MERRSTMVSVGLFFLRLAILILIIAGICRLGEYAYKYCYGVIADVAVDDEPGRDVSVNLTSDMSAKQTAQLLERKGLVEDAEIFSIQLKINKYDNRLKAGNYILNTSMTPKEMMQVLSGETAAEEEEE